MTTSRDAVQHEQTVAGVYHDSVARLFRLLHVTTERVLAVDSLLQRSDQVQWKQRAQRAV